MGDRSGIEWCEATWNPIRGCSIVSEGCRHCYAMRQARRMDHPGGAYEELTMMTPSGPKWTGDVRTVPELLDQPLRWTRPRRIFVNSMSDLFHPDVPAEFIQQVFAVMALAKHHIFQVLTKRPRRMSEFLSYKHCPGAVANEMERLDSGARGSIGRVRYADDWPLPNVWLGTSVEDQATADERIPYLLETPAAVRWLSCEPLLGPVDLRRHLHCPYCRGHSVGDECESCGGRGPTEGYGIDWVVAGGESGTGARPCDVAWIRGLVDQCREAGVPVFVKQLRSQPGFKLEAEERRGNRMPGFHHYDQDAELYIKTMDHSKGGDPEEWPEDLRVREYPEVEPGGCPRGAR